MNTAERNAYRAPDCPVCGRRGMVSWIDERSAGSAGPDWLPTRPRCTNSKCPLSDPREAAAGQRKLSQAAND